VGRRTAEAPRQSLTQSAERRNLEGGLSPELYLRALDSMLKATGRNRQLDLEEGRQSLERDKFEAMKSKGQKLAAEVETAARKGTEVDLKQLAAKVREVYEG